MRFVIFVATIATVLYALPATACPSQGTTEAKAGCGGAKAGGCGGGCGAAEAGGCGGGCGAAKAGGCGGGCGCGSGTMDARIDRGSFAIKSKVAWRSLRQGALEARTRGIPMLVHFSFGTQCEHCKQLAQRVFNDNNVASTLNQNGRAVPVRIPLWAMTAAERAFGEKVGYQEDCVLALVDHTGQVMRSSDGRELKTRGIPDAEALLTTLRPLIN